MARLRVALMIGSTLLVVACSALIAPPARVPCSATGGDPCPTGQACMEGFCQLLCAPERCNAADDDCDGVVDEGFTVDDDADGAPVCRGGRRVDCDDAIASVRPGAVEICNGVDDDCDPATPEDSACRPGERCGIPVRGGAPRCLDPSNCHDVGCADPIGERCVTGATACSPRDGETDCVANANCGANVCDPLSGTCTTLLRDGAACAHGDECASGRCVEAAILGLGPSAPARVCSRACCSNADCAPEAACSVPGNGARGCVDRAHLAIERAPCARDSECPGGLCVRTEGRYSCAVRPVGDRVTGTVCLESRTCRSGDCIGAACVEPCAASVNCPSDERCGLRRGGGVPANPVCFATEGDRQEGESCRTNDECRDGLCMADEPGAQRCAGVCCRDADCAPGRVCTVLTSGAQAQMRCRPRS